MVGIMNSDKLGIRSRGQPANELLPHPSGTGKSYFYPFTHDVSLKRCTILDAQTSEYNFPGRASISA
jgi:hypothetical protein